MKKAILEKELEALAIDKKLIKKLNSHDIYNVKELWLLKRNDLKNLQFSDKEITDIIIKLQLNALDLGKKMY